MQFKTIVNGFIVVLAIVRSVSRIVFLIKRLLTYCLLFDYFCVEGTVLGTDATFTWWDFKKKTEFLIIFRIFNYFFLKLFWF